MCGLPPQSQQYQGIMLRENRACIIDPLFQKWRICRDFEKFSTTTVSFPYRQIYSAPLFSSYIRNYQQTIVACKTKGKIMACYRPSYLIGCACFVNMRVGLCIFLRSSSYIHGRNVRYVHDEKKALPTRSSI
jgi:hypothetical protein